MGIPLNGTYDVATVIVTGTITATAAVNVGNAASTGSSASTGFYGALNFAVWASAFVGTVQIEKTYDNGTTWIPVALDVAGTVASYSLNIASATGFNVTLFEVEHGVNWRVRCTGFTSGTLNYRLSQGNDHVFLGLVSR
jgi:hypothetical protein